MTLSTGAPADGARTRMRGEVRGLIEVATPLIDLLDRETALLREMKPRAIPEFQDDKQRLMRAYENRARSIKEHAGELGALDAGDKSELRQTVARFEDAIKANVFAMRAAHEANERLMQAIVEVLNERRNRHDGYSAKAMRAAGAKSKDGVALTFDQRL